MKIAGGLILTGFFLRIRRPVPWECSSRSCFCCPQGHAPAGPRVTSPHLAKTAGTQPGIGARLSITLRSPTPLMWVRPGLRGPRLLRSLPCKEEAHGLRLRTPTKLPAPTAPSGTVSLQPNMAAQGWEARVKEVTKCGPLSPQLFLGVAYWSA